MQAHVRASPTFSASCKTHVHEHVLVQTNIKTAPFYLQFRASSYEHGHVLVRARGPGHDFYANSHQLWTPFYLLL